MMNEYKTAHESYFRHLQIGLVWLSNPSATSQSDYLLHSHTNLHLTCQSGEGELGDLHPDATPGAAVHIHRLHGRAHDHTGGRGDEVVV